MEVATRHGAEVPTPKEAAAVQGAEVPTAKAAVAVTRETQRVAVAAGEEAVSWVGMAHAWLLLGITQEHQRTEQQDERILFSSTDVQYCGFWQGTC